MQKESRVTGIFVDISREFYKTVRVYCVSNDIKIKTFVLQCLKEGLKNGKKSIK